MLVSTQAPVRRLLATAPGVTAVFGPDDPPPAADAELPLLSLPGVLKIGDDVPPAPYLTADADRPLARALLPAGRRPRIGLAWAGSALHSNDRRRSMRLADLAPLLRGESVHWQSLRKDDAATAIEALGLAASIRALPADADFDDVAALVAGLDLVISVDTAFAHLAGALGTPVWILLPFAPDWRWGVTGTRHPGTGRHGSSGNPAPATGRRSWRASARHSPGSVPPDRADPGAQPSASATSARSSAASGPASSKTAGCAATILRPRSVRQSVSPARRAASAT